MTDPKDEQCLVIYGPASSPTVYASCYTQDQANEAVKSCTRRHGPFASARIVDAVKHSDGKQ